MQKIVRKNQITSSTRNKQNINTSVSDIKTPSPQKKKLISRPIGKQSSQEKIKQQLVQKKVITQEQNLMALMFQYKLVQSYGPLFGIYCIPNSQDYFIWNCMIFIREGYYKQAIFKFDLFINHQNIDLLPKVIFTTLIFHPLINQNTGQLDVNQLLYQKLQQKNMIYQLLRNIKQMFACQDILSNRKSFNPLAAKMFQQKNSFFISKVFQSVLKSKEKFNQIDSSTNILTNQSDNNELFQKLKESLKQICQKKQMPVQQKQRYFSKFIQQTFSQILEQKNNTGNQKQNNISFNDNETDPSQISFEFDQQYMSNVHDTILNE